MSKNQVEISWNESSNVQYDIQYYVYPLTKPVYSQFERFHFWDQILHGITKNYVHKYLPTYVSNY